MNTRKAGRDVESDFEISSALRAARDDLLVVQCRLAALEGTVRFEDLIYCRRLLATVIAEIGKLDCPLLH